MKQPLFIIDINCKLRLFIFWNFWPKKYHCEKKVEARGSGYTPEPKTNSRSSDFISYFLQNHFKRSGRYWKQVNKFIELTVILNNIIWKFLDFIQETIALKLSENILLCSFYLHWFESIRMVGANIYFVSTKVTFLSPTSVMISVQVELGDTFGVEGT